MLSNINDFNEINMKKGFFGHAKLQMILDSFIWLIDYLSRILTENSSEIKIERNENEKVNHTRYDEFPLILNYNDKPETRYNDIIESIIKYIKSGTPNRLSSIIIQENFEDGWKIMTEINNVSLAVTGMEIVNFKKNIQFNYRVIGSRKFNDMTSELKIKNKDYFFHEKDKRIYVNADCIKKALRERQKEFVIPNNYKWFLKNAKNNIVKMFESKLVTITNAVQNEDVKKFVCNKIKENQMKETIKFDLKEIILTRSPF